MAVRSAWWLARPAHSSNAVSLTDQRVAVPATSIPEPSTKDSCRDLRRFQSVAVGVIAAAGLPYLWVLWDLWSGRVNPLRPNGANEIPVYDAQARALMHGHLWVSPGSIHFETWFHGGHEYTYFGIFPSLLRIPVFVFTSSLDGRLTPLSMFVAWIVTGAFSALLLWRLRVLLRGTAQLGWAEAASYGLLLASILAGSVLIYLASVVDYTSEDEAWSVALACVTLFAFVGVLERPSWQRIIASGAAVLFTDLNRPTTGYVAVIAALLIALWFTLGRAGPEQRPWALPMALAGLIPMAVGCAIDLAKFGQPFGAPFSDDYLYRFLEYNKINGGQFFGLRYLPSTLQAYVDPANFRVSSLFPYSVLPDSPARLIAHTKLFTRAPTASVPDSMPLLFIFGLWGVIAAFSRGLPRRSHGLRILLLTSALTAASVMSFGWILERFAADFMPLLVLASMIGMVDLWRRMNGRPRSMKIATLALVGVLALFGFWANVGFAITPGNPGSTSGWSETQLTNYIDAQRAFSDVTGHPIDHYVVVGPSLPAKAATGTLFVQGRCARLFLADEAVTNRGTAYLNHDWLLVEQAPHTPVCHALVKARSESFRAPPKGRL